MTTERIIREHYGIGPLTPSEVLEEIADLLRRAGKGSMDDRERFLFAKLDLGKTKAARRAEIAQLEKERDGAVWVGHRN